MKKTPLYERHAALGAKLVEFGGFLMPLQYTGILDEHHNVRQSAGVFDVSHMGEIIVRGAQALDFLQFLVPNDVARLKENQVLYTCMCYPDGGTVDDLLIYRLPGHYLLVVNAANTDKDVAWINEHAGAFDVVIDHASARFSQLAVQGPQAQNAMAKATGLDLSGLEYFWSQGTELFGQPSLISRTGYTGEDGFEVYASPDVGCQLWDALIEVGVKPVGLGARDSLRFEACLSLYGHELERDISPIEAGLGWTVKDKPVDYLGKAALLAQKQDKPRRLIGLDMKDPGVARQGYPVLLEGTAIGAVTSGMKAPSLDKFLAMALVNRPLEVGTPIEVEIRDATKAARVVKMPFYHGSVKR